MSYTGAVPAAERAVDWRDNGLCRREGETADDWFPTGGGPDALAAAQHAKAVCADCPSLAPCRQWALDTREPAGVWGGLTVKERRNILRQRGVQLPDVDAETAPARTFETVWNARARATGDGHCMWHGGRPIKFSGVHYTPQQIGFILDRGRVPVGQVWRTCARRECVLPAHVADQREREEQSRGSGAPG